MNAVIHRRHQRRLALLNGNLLRMKSAARYAVSKALEAGELCRPTMCHRCRKPCNRPEAHHYRGYDPANWLRVFWVCRPCHAALDKSLSPVLILPLTAEELGLAR